MKEEVTVSVQHVICGSRLARTFHVTATLIIYTWTIFLLIRKMIIIQFAKNCPAALRDYMTAEEYSTMRRDKLAAVSTRLLMDAISMAIVIAKLITDYNLFVWGLTLSYSTDTSHRAIFFPVLDSLITSCAKGPIKCCQFFVLNRPSGFFLAGATGALRDLLVIGAWSALVVHLTDSTGRNSYWIVFVGFNFVKLTWILIYFYILEFLWCVPLGNDDLGLALRDLSECLHRSRRNGIIIDPHKDAPAEVVYVGFPGSEFIIVSSTLIEMMDIEEIQGLVTHVMAKIVNSDSKIRLLFTSVRMLLHVAAWGSSYSNTSMKIMLRFASENLHPFVVPHLVLDLILPTYLDFLRGLEHLIMRQRDFTADEFAVKQGLGSALRAGLLKLAVLNPGDPVFDGWYSAWFLGHGTAVERANRIQRSRARAPRSRDELREKPENHNMIPHNSRESTNKSSRTRIPSNRSQKPSHKDESGNMKNE